MPPPPRRQRPSVPTAAGLEDITTLSLAEIRSRLERNERVLNTALFSPSASPSASPVLATSPTSTTPLHQPTSPSDPLRDKLLLARQQLLAREKELVVQDGMGRMDVGDEDGSPIAESSSGARRRSSSGVGSAVVGGRSGKQRAMETIQAGEGRLAKNGIILPMAQSLALGERDFDNATAQNLASMSLNTPPQAPGTPTRTRHRLRQINPQSPLPSNAQYDPTDEIARAQATARMKAFISYKGDPIDDGDDDDIMDEGWGMEGDYDGEGDRVRLEPQGREARRHERGTGEEVDEFGEDDEDWAEGNDEYLDKVR